MVFSGVMEDEMQHDSSRKGPAVEREHKYVHPRTHTAETHNYIHNKVEVYRYGFFAEFRYPIYKN